MSADLLDGDLSLDQLAARIVGLAGRLAAATCRWLLLIADFDRRDGAAACGLVSTARWLSHCCGVTHRTALDHVRVARALAAFPTLAAAMGAGRLSYSHVRAIARLARDGEERLVGDLVEAAEHGSVGQLETLVRGLRTVEDNERDGVEVADQYYRQSWTSTSQWQMSARLDPERGALVRAAVDQIARSEGVDHASALVRLAEIGLAAVADSGVQPRPLRGDERAAVIIEIDAAALRNDGNDGSEVESRSRERDRDAKQSVEAPCPPRSPSQPTRDGVVGRIRNGPGLPSSVMWRLLCACRIRAAVIDEGGCPLDVGRAHRLVNDRQFRALLRRDQGCAHPGCGSARKLEAHHVRHWLFGGETKMSNLVLLCERHHLAHHAGEFSIGRQGSKLLFLRADGRELSAHIDPSAFTNSARPVDSEYDLPPTTARGKHVGDRLNRDYAIAVLAQRRDGNRRSA